MEQFVRSVAETADKPARIEILVYVDEDDPEQFEYLVTHKSLSADSRVVNLFNFETLIDEPLTTPRINNILAERAQGNILMIANDDQIFVDNGWDIRIDQEASKFPDEIYCMWFNDGRYKETICTFPILSRKWVNTLGYIEPFLFEHFNCDLWTWQIGLLIDRLNYIPDILVEHRHPDTGKSKADETTNRNTRGGRPNRDEAIFAKFERYRILDASLLNDVIKASKR